MDLRCHVKKSTFNIISALVFIISIIILASVTVPLLTSYQKPAEFKEYIESLGVAGFLLMFLVQVSQIIVALIPGELVEFVAGALYGCIGGLIFCMTGIIVGQTIIFKTVRFLGRNFVEKVAGSKLINRFKFLQDEKKLKSIIFFLFFIPGTPKDMLTYIVPLTKINLRDFIITTALARIPSLISSTLAGSAFSRSNLLVFIITYAVIGIFTLTGVLICKKIYLKRKLSDSENKTEIIDEVKEEDLMRL